VTESARTRRRPFGDIQFPGILAAKQSLARRRISIESWAVWRPCAALPQHFVGQCRHVGEDRLAFGTAPVDPHQAAQVHAPVGRQVEALDQRDLAGVGLGLGRSVGRRDGGPIGGEFPSVDHAIHFELRDVGLQSSNALGVLSGIEHGLRALFQGTGFLHCP